MLIHTKQLAIVLACTLAFQNSAFAFPASAIRAAGMTQTAGLTSASTTPSHDPAMELSVEAQNASPVPNGVYRVGGEVVPPQAIYAPNPQYTKEARKAKLQGTVTLLVIVSADGTPRNIKVEKPLGKGLDEKAIEALRQWKFMPATKNGQPVAVVIKVDVNFRLVKNAESQK